MRLRLRRDPPPVPSPVPALPSAAQADQGAAVLNFTPQELELIGARFCVPRGRHQPDPADVAVFIATVRSYRLNPFASQIYAHFEERPDGSHQMTVRATIDGLRLIGLRTGVYRPADLPWYWGPNCGWVNVWNGSDPPVAAYVTVYRRDCEQPSRAIAHYAEYFKPGSDIWLEKPCVMLSKCAEALALRKAYPAETSGLYIDAELERSDASARARATAPTPVLLRAELPAADADDGAAVRPAAGPVVERLRAADPAGDAEPPATPTESADHQRVEHQADAPARVTAVAKPSAAPPARTNTRAFLSTQRADHVVASALRFKLTWAHYAEQLANHDVQCEPEEASVLEAIRGLDNEAADAFLLGVQLQRAELDIAATTNGAAQPSAESAHDPGDEDAAAISASEETHAVATERNGTEPTIASSDGDESVTVAFPTDRAA